jgi:signal transduction histidine kinase
MRLGGFLRRHGLDALVVVLAVLAVVEVWTVPVPGSPPVLVVGRLLATLPLLARRHFPLAASACVFAALAAMTFAHPEATSTSWTIVPLFLAFWAVGAHAEPRAAVAGLVTGVAAIIAVIERDPGVDYADASGHFLVAGGVWLAAVVLQRRARRAAALEELTAALERERREREREAIAEERRRIARDLHDVVAHSVSVMTVQAGAARLLVTEAPERAREPLASVEGTGRQALGEMRRLLGILRGEDGRAQLAPEPGLARLDELLARTCTAGLPVELAVEGEPRALPAGVDLAAYRIVQEALTNARKHAGPARARVTLRYGREALELEIADDGRATANGAGGGHGLVGMRERAALYGGELEAGPRRDGGFAVRARLPVDAGGHVRATTAPNRVAARSEPETAARPRVARLGSALERYWFDALVVLLAIGSEIEIVVGSVPGPMVVTVPAVLLWTLPLTLRRRFPFAAPAVAFAAQAASSFAGEAVGSVGTGFAALLLAFWAVGAHNARGDAIAGLAIGIASLAVIGERDFQVELAQSGNAVLIFVSVWLAALVLQRRGRRAIDLEERAAAVGREREETERAAIAEERRRIARDLHGVIARSVGIMIVQAGAARLLLGEDAERARASLVAVEETGRQALSEMRRLLGILREEDAEAARAPRPGLAQLGDLLAQARRAGLPVELAVEGKPRALPTGVDLAAYRIVQGALINAGAHAGRTSARVAVRYGEQALDLEIADDGRALPHGDSGGHGLAGMRERVALYGGELEAGPRAGGYTVDAHLPLEPSAP